VDAVWEREKPEARKELEKRADSHLSGAPWNDGGRSFSTKERPADYPKKLQKVSIFMKKTHS